jgi:5-methylcytosine-specific restriction endonuclease McrA
VRDPVEIHKRKTFSKKERARLFALYDGICYLSGAKIVPGDAWDVEHVIPLALGGTNDDDNLRLALCDPHKAKTKADVSSIAKAKRLEKKADPLTRKPSRMQSRGFQTNLTKRFDGSVVPRRTK